MEIGDTVHLSDLVLPKGVESVELNKGDAHDLPLVSITLSKTAPTAEEEVEAAE